MTPINTPSLAPSDVPSLEPSATSPSAAPSSSETAELEEPIAESRNGPKNAPEQIRKISTVAAVTGALAFASVMGAGIYYYLKKTRVLDEEPDPVCSPASWTRQYYGDIMVNVLAFYLKYNDED
eukprot:scaffold12806_cov55-Attheya_sp.AAC.7